MNRFSQHSPHPFHVLSILRGAILGALISALLSSFVGDLPASVLRAQETDCASIPRRLPPLGPEIPSDQVRQWKTRLARLSVALEQVPQAHQPDIGALLKACDYAIDLRELYKANDARKVERLIALATERIRETNREPEPGATQTSYSWTRPTGLQVRGFQSAVDDSYQPIGLVFGSAASQAIQQGKQVPLYVWLHGRGDSKTDLHFINERLDKAGQISPDNAIVLHPFGRQCVGYKSAGETDVMEAIDFVCEQYPVDRSRIVLMGFSMGGAGVWHLAAHYGQRFVAASPGAGFAETAQYQRLQPKDYPPEYEQTLWRVYDVPGYVRNLFNLPVVAYSGENDKQIQAARVMEQAYTSEGKSLVHLIGPGMGHKYHPETLKDILGRMEQFATAGKPAAPSEFFIQAPHLRYGSREWLTIDGQVEPYGDTRADAKQIEGRWEITTQNVSRLVIRDPGNQDLRIDGQTIRLKSDVTQVENANGNWKVVEDFPKLRKRPGLCGPIDDAFIDPFLVVLPSQSSGSTAVDSWTKCEASFFQARWKGLMRGEVRVKQDHEVSAEDLERYHIVAWGTPNSNSLIRKIMATEAIPVRWSESAWTVNGKSYASASHMPALVYPNPLSPSKYLVLNSGLTFRPAHDRTNSLQNPHLPDWAVISLEKGPSSETPGQILEAGFFNDAWQFP